MCQHVLSACIYSQAQYHRVTPTKMARAVRVVRKQSIKYATAFFVLKVIIYMY